MSSQGRYLTVNIAGNRYRLAQKKDGTPAYDPTQVQPFSPQYTVGDVSESTMPPEFVPYSFDDFSEGFGLAVTPAEGSTKRYYDISGSLDASLSPEGPVILGPPLNTLVARTYPGAFYGTAPVSGGRLWASGAQVYKSASGTITTPGTLGHTATDAVISYRGGQSQAYLYAPQYTTNAYDTLPQYSTNAGVTWTNVGTTGGMGNCNNMVVIDGEVWVSMPGNIGNAAVARFNDGGPTPTLFGVIDPIGEPTNQIDRLIEFNSRILILKASEGVFVLASDRYSLEQNLLPDLAQNGDTLQVFGAKVWRGILWLPTSRALYAIGPGFGIQEVGPKAVGTRGYGLNSGNGLPGIVAAVAGDAYNLYGWLYGGSQGAGSAGPASRLLKGNVDLAYGQVRSLAWHPVINTTGGSVTAMEVMNDGGANPTLVFDKQFKSAGPILAGVTLPSMGRDPRADPNYVYAPTGTLIAPLCTKRFPGVQAQFLGLRPLCEELGLKLDQATATTAQSVQTGYRLPGSTTYTVNSVQTSGTGNRDALSNLRGRALSVEVILASSDSGTTPQLYALTLDYALQPPPLWQHAMTLDLTSGANAGDGSDGYADPMPAEQALSSLRTLPGNAAFQFTDPWGNQRTAVVKPGNLHPRLAQGPDAGYASGPGLYVDLTVTECQPAGTETVVAGTTYGAIKGQSYLSLRAP